MPKPVSAKRPTATGREKSIYDVLPPDQRLSDQALEDILQKALRGKALKDMPPRTRSKFVKEMVCRALEYPIPSSFTKIRPRFPCHDFDVYIQKSNNLQIWNEVIAPLRRYAVIQVIDDKIKRVKVVNGEALAALDRTGTLTIKYQAAVIPGEADAELVSATDTAPLLAVVRETANLGKSTPTATPEADKLLSISSIFETLKHLVGQSFPDRGVDQDRNRGGELHRLVCAKLGYANFLDRGSFPDIPHQLLEVKLQTSPTIDLGKANPTSEKTLSGITIGEIKPRHRDVRYAVFYARIQQGRVVLTNLYLSTGQDFFTRFPQFQGMKVNKKIQLPLPKNFFTE